VPLQPFRDELVRRRRITPLLFYVAALLSVIAGALLETALREFPERPKIVNRMPVDTKIRACSFLSPHKVFVEGRTLNVLKFRVFSGNPE
jgi:hypothetical protein